ncbi:phage major capsid protein [Inediibacterium massiliense]|uniref:phage major capsid protein n=1 Tax=Inediibacterium massiliense TaxID=1658111 RepID=UPI0006B66A95|nr:phage major capsid protein [Inediibacterium massiliense]
MKKSDEIKQVITELRGQKEALETEVRCLMKNEIDKAEEKMKEVRNINKQITMQEELLASALDEEERNLNNTENREVVKDMKKENKTEVRYSDVFCKYVRNMCLDEDQKKPFSEEEKRALSSNRDESGKLLIPQDLSTKVMELKREYMDMYDHVNVEPVGTVSGHRPIETDAIHTPFEGVAELTSIPDAGSPKFSKIEFNVKDFKGLIEIPNSLLKDETGDLMGHLAKWIAKKMVATHNTLIFYANGINGTEGILGVETDGFTIEKANNPLDKKKIKNILNVKLPSGISKNAVLYTNQSGFDYLDGLEDGQKRDLLEELGDNRYKLDKKTLTIIKFDDETLKADADGKVPFIFGNAKEGITYFDREKMSMASSKEAGFENDSTKVRVITRGDVRHVDKKALYVVYAPLA